MSLTLAEAPSTESVQSQTIASAKSLVLTYNGKTQIFTVNSMMRLIASLAPASQLQGKSDIESAQIDGWVSFVWNSFEVPLEVLEIDSECIDAVKADLAASLAIVEWHLKEKTYIVGDMISLADISLATVLYRAVSCHVLTVTSSNAARWYESVTKQDFFLEALKQPVANGTVIGRS